MKVEMDFCNAFRRAMGFFPAPAVIIDDGQTRLNLLGICAVSADPPMVALSLPCGVNELPSGPFVIATNGVKLCLLPEEARQTGDHILLLWNVETIDVRGDEQPVASWRRAAFRLQFDYPFLESPAMLDQFVADWMAGVLPKRSWTHSAHVAVTGYHAFDHPAGAVFDLMKRDILHFNSCVGTVNGPDSGYHETLTQFWSDMIARHVTKAKPASRFDAAVHAVRLFGEDRDLPSLYYSFDVVRDRRARAEWVAPDLAPRPEWCGAWAR